MFPKFALPSGCQIEGEPHVVQDRLGTLWAIGSKSPLLRSLQGLCAPVFAPDEPNPFFEGGNIYEALVDSHGNAFLRTTDFTLEGIDTFVLIRATSPPPKTSVAIERVGGNSVRVRMSSNATGAPWFTWRLNGGEWQPLKHEREVLLTTLPKGDHTVEAQAVDEKLQPDPSPARARFEIKVDAKKQIAAFIDALKSGELSQREAASKALVQYGVQALKALRGAREQASDSQRWWIDATIQKIERSQAKPTNRGAM